MGRSTQGKGTQVIIKQKCPMCEETLEYEVMSHAMDGLDDEGNTTMTIEAQTTPASTEHVWTHKPK